MTTLSLDELALEEELLAELRSDHAGEYGAVAIYDGILAVTRSPEVRRFARAHRETEKKHLTFMEDFLPPSQRTRLLPLWKVAAWLLGAGPALLGPRAVFVTIEAVEQFVEGHYQRQIAMMDGRDELRDLRQVLLRFCAEEVDHKDDAGNRHAGVKGVVARSWAKLVDVGSAAAVALSKRI